ncbi:hypothetical protein EJ377_15770 [Chryseobacterium arthrosphaerae]|uniref:Uncharacterized protein n=1 Tax=Chryseobacterium arthrosphaerae TaxID=651561 RepID=A0A432DSD0_9FLAO|nr:hypothetical protein EJ377_15770 [Chryseobacterium arthrosphaerae]
MIGLPGIIKMIIKEMKIFAHHGFIGIWHLTTRYEVRFLWLTANGVEKFYIPLLDHAQELTVEDLKQ